MIDYSKLEYGQWAQIKGEAERCMVVDWDATVDAVKVYGFGEYSWHYGFQIEGQPTDFSNGTN